MAGRDETVGIFAAALRGLPRIECGVFLAMLDECGTYPVVAARLEIGVEDAERTFAAALVGLADALDAPPPASAARRWLRRIAAAARLARWRSRR